LKSWEVLRDATERVGAKALAAKLRLSSALIYKWCQEPSAVDPASSGAFNPLDRLKKIFDATGDERIINWLCHEAGGFFVRNPQVDLANRDSQLLDATQRVVEEFGRLLSAVSRSIANDGAITDEEADHIRECWERLKFHAEEFVVACEQGNFSSKR
jgi:hypothetical protein